MLVDRFLARSARRFPDKIGLVCAGQRLTYRQIDQATDTVASGLRQLGVGRGDRVVIHLENGVDAVLAVFGTLKAGGAFVVVNPTTKAEKLGYILDDSQAAVLVSDARSEVVERVCGRVPRIVLSGTTPAAAPAGMVAFETLLAGEASDDEVFAQRIDLDCAAIVYTSGSTGIPKGVTLSHGNVVAAATSITTYLANTEDDVILNVLPLSFDYGLYQLLMAFALGATLVLERSFAYPPMLLDALVRERVTGFPIVPTIAALLLRHDLRSYDFSALRYMTSTGAAFPPAHIAALRACLPHVRLYSMYGITESKRVSFLSPDELDARPDSVGKPMPNVEVFVADDQGRLHEHGTGELVVRGSNVMQGYWGRPEDTDRVLRPGLLPGERVLFTGDIFRIDDQGYMYFLSRKDDIIKSRGEKISPKEIETVLYELPSVVEAAVIGVPDPILGYAVKACITLQPGTHMTEHEISRHCAQRLEDLLVPRVIEFMPQMPRTSTGKIDRLELERRAG